MKKIFILLIGLCLSINMMAQTKAISGSVTDPSGEPLIGVSVTEIGTANGMATDLNGKFSLTVSSQGKLRFSYLGYKTQEIAISEQTANLQVVLQEDASTLEEVVVTGYGGLQKRTTLTTSISKLDNKALANVALSNAGQALQGEIAGLRVVNTSGKPGTSPNIVLRGGATITGKDNQALVVVDGLVRSMDDINPADIESIQVLKDAASTAIYGARANSGVILVTTKRGKEGNASVSYKFKGGLNYARKGYEFLDAENYLYYNRLGNKYNGNRTLQQVNNSTGYGTNAGDLFSVKYLTDSNKHLLNEGWKQMTDPYDGTGQLIFKDYSGEMMDAAFNDPSFTQDHYLSIAGGNETATFSASVGYYKEEGQVVNTSYDRITGSLNGSYKIRKNLKMFGGASFSYAKNPGLWISEAQLFYRSMSLWPTWNPYDADGNPASGTGTADGNPMYYIDKLQRLNNTRRTTFNIGGSWEIVSGLTLNENSSIYYVDNEQEDFDKKYKLQNQSAANDTRAARGMYERQFQQQHALTLDYNKTFDKKHNVTAMLGGEYFDYERFRLQARGQKAPSDDIPTLNASSDRTEVYSYKEGYRMLSGFGRVNYDYEYKYLLSLVARYDGISKLSDNRWGFFPGISGGWNIHEESFYKDSQLSKMVSTVKPRISYGENGNVAGLGNYDVYGAYGTQTAYNGSIGYLNTGLINGDLRWEKSKSLEVGLDLGFLQNRFNLVLDYYSRTTDDLLTNLDLPGYTGFTSIKTNLGTLRNSGFEAEIKLKLLDNYKGFSWDFAVNSAYVTNKILKLPFNGNENNRQGGMQVYDPKSGQNVWVGGYQEGKGLGDIYAYKQVRIFKDWDDINANAANRYDAVAELYGPEAWAKLTNKTGKKQIEPGDVMWEDLNGDGTINSYDQVKIGNVFPKWTGGFSTNLTYNNFNLFARFDYALGHTIYNDLAARSLGQYQGTFNIITMVKDSWTPENTGSDLPKFYYADQLSKKNITRGNNASATVNSNSSRFYEKGDYLAIREITLNYKLPKQIVNKMNMSDVSVYLTGQNLIYFTGYSGMSPEPPVNATSPGVDEGRYPMPRTVLAGVSITF